MEFSDEKARYFDPPPTQTLGANWRYDRVQAAKRKSVSGAVSGRGVDDGNPR